MSYVSMSRNNLEILTDEELDRLTENIFRSVVLTNEETEEIAASPRLWWQLQSRIIDQKTQRQKRRFFAWSRFAATAFGALAIVFGVFVGAWFYNSGQPQIAIVPEQKPIAVRQNESQQPQLTDEAIKPAVNDESAERPKISAVKAFKKSSKSPVKSDFNPVRATPKKPLKTNQLKTEVATNFIPLSYLPVTESGQVVRVKVPRSMMVSLGVTTNTERSAELVNAEVIIADDGGARAIRFLQ